MKNIVPIFYPIHAITATNVETAHLGVNSLHLCKVGMQLVRCEFV